MKERTFTFLCALGALALFIAMFVRREGALDYRNEIPRPTTAERRGNGYNAAQTWLEAEKIRSLSLRERFDKLAALKGLAPTGNLLIVTLPAATGFRTEEFLPLDRWIRAGNTLLVLAALSDNPDWGANSAGVALGDLNLLTGLEFETATNRKLRLLKERNPSAAEAAEAADRAAVTVANFRALAQPQRSTLLPNRAHAYFNGVRSAVALSDFPPHAWTVKVPYEGFVLELARQRETGEGVFWTRSLGEGRIVVSGFGSLFTNRVLGLADNGRLLANIVATTVQPGGVVLFDDGHQGVGASYDPQKFYQDGRFYATLGVLLALWLIWVLGSTRLRAPEAGRAPPREIELTRTAGGFLARVLPRDAAARRLFEFFFRRINARAQRHGDAEPWEVLERHPRVARADLEQLKRWYADCRAARRVPLRALYNLLLRIDGQTA